MTPNSPVIILVTSLAIIQIIVITIDFELQIKSNNDISEKLDKIISGNYTKFLGLTNITASKYSSIAPDKIPLDEQVTVRYNHTTWTLENMSNPKLVSFVNCDIDPIECKSIMEFMK